MWPRPNPGDQDLNKLESSLPEDVTTQVTAILSDRFLIRFVKIFLYIPGFMISSNLIFSLAEDGFIQVTAFLADRFLRRILNNFLFIFLCKKFDPTSPIEAQSYPRGIISICIPFFKFYPSIMAKPYHREFSHSKFTSTLVCFHTICSFSCFLSMVLEKMCLRNAKNFLIIFNYFPLKEGVALRVEKKLKPLYQMIICAKYG